MTTPVPQSLVAALLTPLTTRQEILEAYVFGSLTRGETTSLSDVDVAVYVDRAYVVSSPYGYAADLSASLGGAAGRRDIDVVVLNDAPPLLYHRVIAGGERILSRDLRATTTREGQALSRYCDYLPKIRQIDEMIAARLAAGTFGR